jgi:predicted RNase H-like nuclease (RuvC/YqgF family)
MSQEQYQCNECGTELDGNDSVYCEGCVEEFREALRELKDEVGELREENERLEEMLDSHREE